MTVTRSKQCPDERGGITTCRQTIFFQQNSRKESNEIAEDERKAAGEMDSNKMDS